LVTLNLYAATGNALIGDVAVSKLTRLDVASELAGDVTVEHGISGVSRIVASQMLLKTNVQPSAPMVWIKDGDLELFQLLGRTDPHTNPSPELAAMAEGSILQVDLGNVDTIHMGDAGSSFIGTIEGVINVPTGSISTIQVENGTITDPTNNPATNYRILAKNGIGSITADAIDCDIITNNTLVPTTSQPQTGLGYLRQFTTSTGDFKGVLTTRGIGNPNSLALPFHVDIARDVVGTIDATESILAPTGLPAITIGRNLTAGSVIRARNSLAGSSADGGVQFTSGSGLKGQIIINSNLNSSLWQSNVGVGSTALQPDSFGGAGYATASASVGGGAVGTVPYRLYKSDCVVPGLANGLPSNGTVFYILPSQMETGIDLRFYGPVKAKVAGVAPLRVFKPFSGMNGEAFIADLSCYTDQVLGPIDVDPSARSRTVRVKTNAAHSPFPIGYYRITSANPSDSSVQYRCDMDPNTPDPARTTLVCDLATNSSGVAPGVSMFDVYFIVVNDCDGDGVASQNDLYSCPGNCPADLDDGTGTCTPDGGVDVNDLLMFLTSFEAGTLCADLTDAQGGSPDGGVDIDDLLFFLAHFEMGC
jgi:hypothetical protein